MNKKLVEKELLAIAKSLSDNSSRIAGQEGEFIRRALNTVDQRIEQARGVLQMAALRIDKVGKDIDALHYSEEFSDTVVDILEKVYHLEKALIAFKKKNDRIG